MFLENGVWGRMEGHYYVIIVFLKMNAPSGPGIFTLQHSARGSKNDYAGFSSGKRMQQDYPEYGLQYILLYKTGLQ